eukprot:9337871-Ditylum_brightwellii.AAC.1
MVCRLIALDKCPGTQPVGISEIFCGLITKLVIRAIEDNAKLACSNLQLCAGMEAGIEGAVHAVRMQQDKRRLATLPTGEAAQEVEDPELADMPGTISREEDIEVEQEGEDEAETEEEDGGAVVEENGPITQEPLPEEMGMGEEGRAAVGESAGEESGMEEGEAMEVEPMEAEEEEEPARLVLGNGPGGTTLVDARNGFNKLSRLAMLWTVRHQWQQGACFLFNCYHHWALLIIQQPSAPPVILHSKEGVTPWQ